MNEPQKTKVFYDGSCPICTREIAFYQRRSGAGTVEWIDITKLDSDYVYPGISRQTAMSRFHVVTPEGEILIGGTAFAGLWRCLSAFRFFGWLFRFRPLDWILNRFYDLLLKIRPALQQWYR